ncbi:MAG: N-acetylmuramoyl-L-alanine amidase [Verrucomicrobia bacterium]|nr:N-acetylmuramoyl-L-alanine amidase [Verrucomicrobiota bacterium]
MEHERNHQTTIRGGMRILAAALLSGIAAALLSSCESTGGRYGPGAGNFSTVIVDAGHGGHDQGAKACSGAPEKMLTLDTARRLAAVLRSRGVHVIETRTGDYFVTLGGRTAISNRSGQAVFVSVHYNWTKRRGAQGIEIYYNSRRSMRLAANILRETLGAYHAGNRGVKSGRFYVLRHNRRPAVLCELGFVSNPGDNQNLQSAAVRQRLAERVASGILAEQAGRNP